MKKLIISILFSCFVNVAFGQIYEVGGFVGGSNFIGDIGRMNYIYPNALGGGVVFKYNRNPRVAFRANYNYIGLKGDDKSSTNPMREYRNISFSNSIHEFAIGTEFNFFHYNIKDQERAYTPYILAQVALMSYKAPQSLNKSTSEIETKSAMSYTIPLGLGFKGRISDHLAFAIESGVRFTFKDDLDFTTDKIPSLNFGGNGNDHYVFTGVSIVYAFGRPPCFSDSL